MLPSDRHVAARAFGVAWILFAVAFAISAASDEGGVRFGIRLARALPLAPLCAAISVFLTLGSARAKVDALALEAIGRTPVFNNAGAVLGGAAFALLASGAVGLSSKIDIDAIFPAFSSGPHVFWDGSAFVDSERAVRFDAQGNVTPYDVQRAKDAEPTVVARAPHERGAASLSLSFAALAFPLFAAAATRRIAPVVLIAIAGSAFLTFLAFDAVASGRAPAITVALPQAALLFYAVVEYRRSAWLVPL